MVMFNVDKIRDLIVEVSLNASLASAEKKANKNKPLEMENSKIFEQIFKNLLIIIRQKEE